MTELTAAPALDLSLFHLDADLAGLLEYRQERLADAQEPPSAEELAALDGEIRRYMEALPAKVSGVAAVYRSWRAKRAVAKQEMERLGRIIAHFDAMESRLKEYCGEVLERQPEPKKGCRKLTGADGSTISLRGNGGLAPLRIQEDVLPDEMRDATVRMPLPSWRFVQEALSVAGQEIKVEPANTRIREALQDGAVPGAWLEDRGVHIEVR